MERKGWGDGQGDCEADRVIMMVVVMAGGSAPQHDGPVVQRRARNAQLRSDRKSGSAREVLELHRPRAQLNGRGLGLELGLGYGRVRVRVTVRVRFWVRVRVDVVPLERCSSGLGVTSIV
jgi:hypothetical protein